jgi:hypothetical protein
MESNDEFYRDVGEVFGPDLQRSYSDAVERNINAGYVGCWL